MIIIEAVQSISVVILVDFVFSLFRSLTKGFKSRTEKHLVYKYLKDCFCKLVLYKCFFERQQLFIFICRLHMMFLYLELFSTLFQVSPVLI